MKDGEDVELDPIKPTSAINVGEDERIPPDTCVWNGASYGLGGWLCWGGSKMVCEKHGDITSWINHGPCR